MENHPILNNKKYIEIHLQMISNGLVFPFVMLVFVGVTIWNRWNTRKLSGKIGEHFQNSFIFKVPMVNFHYLGSKKDVKVVKSQAPIWTKLNNDSNIS